MAELVDMLCVGHPRDTFHKFKQALKQALTLMFVNSLDYDHDFGRFWWRFRSCLNWNISKGAFEWVL